MQSIRSIIFHLIGNDNTKLIYRFSGGNFRLTAVAGEVVHQIIGEEKGIAKKRG